MHELEIQPGIDQPCSAENAGAATHDVRRGFDGIDVDALVDGLGLGVGLLGLGLGLD